MVGRDIGTPPEPGLVTYTPALRGAFRALNLEWLESNQLLEPADLKTLDDPERAVLAGGGQIFFAMRGATPVGCCAAVRVDDETFELAKLAVAPSSRGRGLGRLLASAVCDFARERGARRVFLTSSTKLQAAVRLYESLGFRHVPMPPDCPYVTADVAMELALGRTAGRENR